MGRPGNEMADALADLLAKEVIQGVPLEQVLLPRPVGANTRRAQIQSVAQGARGGPQYPSWDQGAL
eukprot:3628511-Alexandrium_andersonii.AAC.1